MRMVAATTFLILIVSSNWADEPPTKKADPTELPGKGKVKWLTQGVNDRFNLIRTRYDSENGLVSWLLEAKSDLSVKPAELGTGLFDADKVRLLHADLAVEGGIPDFTGAPPPGVGGGLGGAPLMMPTSYRVLKGERIRVILSLPETETWDKVAYVVLASKAVPPDEPGKP